MNCITITGASGFLGSNLIPYLITKYRPKSIRLFARDEWKMAQTIKKYKDDRYDLLRPCIGDVKDLDRVMSVINGSDLVIHTAALKRLEMGNCCPQEVVKTNVIGSMNILHAVLNVPEKPKKVVFVSSDKAVKPTNLYGGTKSVMESMVTMRVTTRAKYLGISLPTMCCVRYGNVVNSTGAAIPMFISLAKRNLPITIFDPNMTRFLITTEQALGIIGDAIDNGRQGQIILPKVLRAVNVKKAAEWIRDYLGSKSEIIKGTPYEGEKIHEEIDLERDSSKYLINRKQFIEILKWEELV